MARETKEKFFTKENFEKFLKGREEPEFMLKNRREAFEIFSGLPWPDTKMEEWRRTNISHLPLEEYPLLKTPGKAGEKGKLPEVAGYLSFSGYTCTEALLKEEVSSKGVVLKTLEKALVDHPELIEKHLGHLVSPDQGKFEALNGAFWTQGAFLYVPKGEEVKMPFQIDFEELDEHYASMPYILVVLEEGASAVLFHRTFSRGTGGDLFRNGRMEFFLGNNSSLTFGDIQRLNNQSLYFWNGAARVGRDGRLSTLVANFGSSLLKSRLEIYMEGEGGEAQVGGVYFADGKQHFDQKTLQHHRSPHTTSNLFYRGAIQDKGYTIYQGLIEVEKGANKINAYQTNNNLLLSDKARADSIPGLQIKTDDLKCGHGSTVGKINEQQIFYLMTRGISRQEAKTLLVMGFLEQVLQKTSETFKNQILGAISAKLGVILREEDLKEV